MIWLTGLINAVGGSRDDYRHISAKQPLRSFVLSCHQEGVCREWYNALDLHTRKARRL
jgi:hypothetical protein